MKPVKTPYYSWKLGSLARGCQLCVKGEKTVLFVTGLCPRNCFFCPVSDKKHQHDVTYANEWPTGNIADIIKEAELCNSKGAGFTGGDPLVKINRTVSYIKDLKQHFGKKFHIHLYTSFDLVTEDRLKLLYAAGLDEIRFHADLQDSRFWDRINIANKFSWDVGVEIPVIPTMKSQTEKLLTFLNKKIKFLNLNELEVSDAEASKVSKMFKTKDALSYGVKGSEKLGLELMKFAKDSNFPYSVHYCTAKLKDAVQLSKRIQRRAKSTKRPFDILEKDGTLTRGAIYLPYLCPSIGYEKKLSSLNQKQRSIVLKKFSIFKLHLMRTYDVPKELLFIDAHKLRLLTNIKVARELAKQIKSSGLKPAVVTEYPTWDELIVELEWV